MSDDRAMTIGEVAKRTGLSTQAIRYYEHEALLPKPGRTHTSYRLYGPELVGRLNFIRTARTLGLSLAEIKEIFRISQQGRSPCRQVRELLAGKFEELNQRIAELTRLREEMRGLLKKLSAVPDQADTSQRICALIEMAPSLLPPSAITHPRTDRRLSRNYSRRTRNRARS